MWRGIAMVEGSRVPGNLMPSAPMFSSSASANGYEVAVNMVVNSGQTGLRTSTVTPSSWIAKGRPKDRDTTLRRSVSGRQQTC